MIRKISLSIFCSALLWIPSLLCSSGFVIETIQTELQKNFQKLKKTENPPYYLSYLITEIEEDSISANYGATENSSHRKYRHLDTDLRVGTFGLDNTHLGRSGSHGNRRIESASIPVENDPPAFKNTIWMETDQAHKNAVERFLKLESQKKVKAEEDDPSPDFSPAPKQTFSTDVSSLTFEKNQWEEKLKRWSGIFKSYPEIYGSGLRLTAVRSMKYFVNSEGTLLQTGRNHVRLTIQAETQAEDGMQFSLNKTFDGSTLESLPDEAQVSDNIQAMAKNLLALKSAPLAEPYSGPAILSGRAAAVFFHEVLGHRLEGHRQKIESEGQTFTKKVGEQILPAFISVVDDPTTDHLGGFELNGSYLYDDEGIKAERAVLIKKGILNNFLMSRSLIKGFNRSNGHGRKQAGYRTVARQGNLIVESEKMASESELRKKLKEEIRKKNKPYGLFFKEIEGGFTYTGRILPNAFNVRPLLVYRVFAAERPDQLVRGADLIGTPLAPLSKILVTGDKKEIFNGYCGAESGSLPVSAAAPSILVSEIEIQKKEKSDERPPILKPPLQDPSAK